MGYEEHPGKFNLFCRRYRNVEFYADMRGNRDFPIWAVKYPSLYWRWLSPAPEIAIQQRIVFIEWIRLSNQLPLKMSCLDIDFGDCQDAYLAHNTDEHLQQGAGNRLAYELEEAHQKNE